LVQSVPNYSVSKMIYKLKSVTAKELIGSSRRLKTKLWVVKFWTIGYYANSVSQYLNEDVKRSYVKKQGMEKKYKKVHSDQVALF